MQKPPSLRNNNGSLQVRVRIDGKDAFINRLGRCSDPVAVAKAHAIAAQIWSDYQQGVFDRSLMAYQPLIGGKEVGLLEALRVRAETKRQAASIHAYKLLQRYGLPIRNRSDAEGFLGWLRAEGLGDSQGRLKVCPGSSWRCCQHWVRSAGLRSPNARNLLHRSRSARIG